MNIVFATFFVIVFLALGLKCEGGGTINDLFNAVETEYFSQSNAHLKRTIDVDGRTLHDNWDRMMKKLSKQLEKISEVGSGLIPVTAFKRIEKNGGRIPEGIAEKVRKRGVLIVKETIPKKEIKTLMDDLIKYLHVNDAFPKEGNQSVYEIYWSKAQMKSRQHPNMNAVQKSLLNLWHVNGDNLVDVNLDRPLMYVDRLRIRPPGDKTFNLPPHVDGGGVERWEDPVYRKVYRHILEGNYEEFDPFEVDYRVEANMNNQGYHDGCTFFRAFQGWLATSSSGPGQGTLRVLPLLKEPTVYWMLRPFFSDVPEDLFPGTYPSKTMHISKTWHHDLYNALVTIPEVEPGDTVWWHPDLIHSVETEHHGEDHSSVFYIPAGPDCPINRDYLRRMRHAFVLGQSPPDFPVNDYENTFNDRATLEDVTELGKNMMGWDTEEALEKTRSNDMCRV